MSNRVDLGGGAKAVFDWGVFEKIRQEAVSLCMEKAHELAAAADAYPQPAETKKYAVRTGKHNKVIVYPRTAHARNSNAKHNSLVKKLGEL